MVQLTNHNQIQQVSNLPFCYWCGKEFGLGDETNRDHVPPKNLFDSNDRSPPITLKTHICCNREHKNTDEKMGQLLALNREYVTPDPKNRRLQMDRYSNSQFGAGSNVEIIDAIWRYIHAFHAALYREPLKFGSPAQRTITTPFTPARIVDGELELEDIKANQYLYIVKVIKDQRAANNVDRITSNNNQLKYECVWVLADDKSRVLTGRSPIRPRYACFFALEIYDWKRLGDVGITPARGCAGAYFSSDGQVPSEASLFSESAPSAANEELWDPFGQ